MFASTASVSRITPLRASHARPRRSLIVQASTLWALAPRPSKPQFFDASDVKHPIDLTDIIGTKRVCSVGAKDYGNKTNEAMDFTVVDHGGVHLVFEAEGTSNPLDSPSVLFLTDIDSECDILVDGQPISKGSRIKLHPGATIDMGEGACYIVHRNVFAHA